ncbi:MAG: adenosylmethionine--8-amino-7-oxononanoate transaminase [Candidatus Omnitrophica bacterium]|nr:adenosylmethionine--8-amino-7-oxononanoate transaminase [Candidatus Omnitrophota bacterium]
MNKKKDDYINPLDFFEDSDEVLDEKVIVVEDESESGVLNASSRRGNRSKAKLARAFFISATDTGVGKTTAIKVIGTLLKDQGLDVGVMKPVQCGGDDAKSLKEFLQSTDPMAEINPYFAKEPVSPHISFKREEMQVHREKIISIFQKLRRRHDVLLVEGAGGLMVPIREDYLIADLVKDLGLEMVIVSRLGLGTINHTLLTIAKARDMGISVSGVIFSETEKKTVGIPEKTNPSAIKELSKVPGLGIIPFCEDISAETILKVCKGKIDLKPFLSQSHSNRTGRLAQDDKNCVWHPFTQMKDWLASDPVVIDRAQGCHLIDTNGRHYLDGVSSLWVNIHGHNHPHITAALKDQLNHLDHSTFLGLSNAPAVELAKKLIAIAPKGLERVFYSDNGSTAVEVAIKMAYQYWQNVGRSQKKKIIHLANSYHGDTLGGVSVGGIDLFHKVYQDLIFPTVQIDFPDGYHRQNYDEAMVKLEEVLGKSADEIAALIVEPLVQGAAGILVWPDGILKRMKDFCEKHEIFLIADEVATGFGRTGKMFACEHESVTPDFLCLAKGLTGGSLPLAATLTTKKVFEGFLFDYKEQKTFFHGHTYTGNPLACRAALANLEIFSKEHTLARLQPKINILSEKLKMFYNLPHVGHIRQKGFMVGIELVKDKATQQPFDWEEQIGVKVCEMARQRGVLLRPLGNVIVLMPPLAISKRELDYLLRVTHWAINKVG